MQSTVSVVHVLQTFATMSSTEASTAGGLKRFRHITRPFLCTSMWLCVCFLHVCTMALNLFGIVR